MDFEQISRSLLPLLGGKENIASAAHCATRLRLVLVDDALADQQAIGKIEGVKDVFATPDRCRLFWHRGGEQSVRRFYSGRWRRRIQQVGSRQYRGEKLNPFQRIARLLSNIFVPIIPAIVASGLLMGLLGMVKPTAGSTRATLSTLSRICAAPRRLLFCRS